MSSESFAEMQYKVARTMNGDGVNSFGGLIVVKKKKNLCSVKGLTSLSSFLQYSFLQAYSMKSHINGSAFVRHPLEATTNIAGVWKRLHTEVEELLQISLM